MPNSYAVVPGIIPGTVSVGGDLDVKGEIRIGTQTARARLLRNASNEFRLHNNLQANGTTRDDAAQGAWGVILNSASFAALIARQNAAGTAESEALGNTFLTDYTSHDHTGTTTEDTIYSKTIPANLLGTNGALLVRLFINAQVQGAGSTAPRLYLGTTLVGLGLIAAVGGYEAKVWIGNRNAANVQAVMRRMDQVATLPDIVFTTLAEDTTADRSLQIRVQNANATDRQQFNLLTVHMLNSFGPVT